MPIPVIAPLIVLVLGFGLAPKILIVALICFFPVDVNLADGLRDTDPDARKLLRSLRRDALAAAALPRGARRRCPPAFTGVKIAAAVAVIGAVFAEWAGSDSGLGHLLLTANGQLETARAFAATVLLFADGRRALRRCSRCSSAGSSPGPRDRRPMKRLLARRRWPRCSLAGCGEKAEPTGTRRRRQEPFTVMLDYFPNADHAGIYAAQAAGRTRKAGLDVKIPPPPDPAAPLKLLRAGKADLVISYEPELLLARDQGATNLVRVGALVQTPLTSLMALGSARSARPRTWPASASAPPASPTSRPT